MKETTGHDDNKQRPSPTGEIPDESVDELLSSYSPNHRRILVKGLRILADVAIRTHMKRQADVDAGEPAQDDGEVERA